MRSGRVYLCPVSVTPYRWAGNATWTHEPCPGLYRPVLVRKTCALLATPLSWLLALDRWLCVPAFRRVCLRSLVESRVAFSGGPQSSYQQTEYA